MLHLVKRFFGHLTAKALTDEECADIESMLSPDMLALFVAMPAADQRHSLDVWDRVDRRPDLAQAALLHDVGKVGGPKGAVARSLATVGIKTGIPVMGGWLRYRDHGSIGADMLRHVDADPLAIAFAAWHPGPPPQDVSGSDWQALLEADDI